MRRGAWVVVLAALLSASCSEGTSSPGQATPSTTTADLTIFAAASLAGVMEQAKTTYEAAIPGASLTISTDSSAALETQIEQGAPADVFLAADTSAPKKLIDGGFVAGEAIVFAGNELTVIVPKGNPGAIASPADLARDGIRVIAAGKSVPITTYATQLLSNLAKDPGYPPYFRQRYAANVVSWEDNVKAVVAKIAVGEGDAAIVYVTDAKATTDVETVHVPDDANVPASYAGVVVKASAHADAAKAFLDWFAGPAGQTILRRFGFLPPPS